MQTGMYLNSLICLLIAIFSFDTAWFVYKNNKNNLAEISYASFWLFVSLTWLLFGISLVLFKMGMVNLSLSINQYVVQTFGMMQIAAVSYFVFFRLTRNKKIALIIFWLLIPLFIIGLYFNYQPGSVSLMFSSYYSFEYTINGVYWRIFQALFTLVVLAAMIDFCKNLYYWFKKKESFDFRYFFCSFSVIVYGMIGYFEESGATATWMSTIFRLAIALCAYISLLSYKDKEI